MARTCIYCVTEREDDEFSDEHIWPNALGGDFLDRFWRSDDVCGTCNSVSGVFVDGGFIKNWLGAAERSAGARDYLRMTTEKVGRLPLDYLGSLKGLAPPPDCQVDYWAGPCGANILHIRPADKDEIWETYAGGDPRAKKSRAGRAYLLLTSEAPFWIMVSLASFGTHFTRARKRIVTQGLTEPYLRPYGIEQFDPAEYPHDTDYIHRFKAASGGKIQSRLSASVDAGNRMLCKVALGVGCGLFGNHFSHTPTGERLRRAFREADSSKRRQMPVRGSGLLSGLDKSLDVTLLAWTGAWVLLILETGKAELVLVVVSPSAKVMSAVITDDPALVAKSAGAYREGVVWITIPTVGEAANALPMPDYIAHQAGILRHPELQRLEALRSDPDLLPPCA